MFRRPFFLLSLVLLSLFPRAGSAQADKSIPVARKDRHALLIGVTFYENLPPAKHLAGPANDVLLMRKLLLEKFRFDPKQIVVLSEEAGKERGKDFLPTKANIKREFERLSQVALAGEQVVIHMGGHGSQQPENKNSPDPEPDGLDEIFLPRDVGAWNGAKGSVANAIIDDEMGAWLKAIRDKKSSVWITFDSCHSGTMTRGGDDKEKARDLDPVKDLGIPKTAIQEAEAFAAQRDANQPDRARGNETPPAFKMAKEGGIVAIYACQPNEVTYEREMPPQNKEGKVYGLLTYSLCKILTEATEKSKEPLTYNELARRIYGQYAQWGRVSPTPLIEGVDRDRQILGDKVWPGRSSIILQDGKEGLQINAGALHGLTDGSILAVTPPPGNGEMLLGHVRIKELRAYNSAVEPCAYEKTPQVKEFPDGAVCKAVFVDMGDRQLKVAVDPRDANDKAVPDATRLNLEKILQGLGGKQSLIRPVEKTSESDWLLRMQEKNVVLVRGTNSSARVPINKAMSTVIDENLGDWLKDRLTRIARAESLKRLAAIGETSGDSPIRLELKMTRKKNKLDKRGSIPIAWPEPDVMAFDDDRVVFKITNKGKIPVDVTMLYVDSGFGIDCLYPPPGDDNRLRPGDTEYPSIRFKNDTIGIENLIIIAVKAQGQPVDFGQLAQPPLEIKQTAVINRGESLNRALETPLGSLLKRGMFGEGKSRGASAEEMEDYSMLTVSFNVRPQKRPAANGK